MLLKELLLLTLNNQASDLHLSSGLPPVLRIDGELQQQDLPVITEAMATELFHAMMDIPSQTLFATKHEVDFALTMSDMGRFRVNIFKQNCGIAGVLRTIPAQIKSLAELDMPKIFYELVKTRNGIILITGPAGSGKSTTLAAMLDHINNSYAKHIITIEDPIEFLHASKKSLIHQREVMRDTLSFKNALRAALREDPDIILVGELRDLETIRLALTAAETGHLVVATLHTSSAAKTINRLVDVFAETEKLTVRTMLAESLQAVISQTLVKKIGGGRTAVLEIMLCTGAIRNLIREGKIMQINSTIQTSKELGMQTLDHHLNELVNRQIITRETALEMAFNKEALQTIK